MAGMKPFRFGVNVWRAGSRIEWADKARKLEDLGYDSLSVPDHLADFFSPMPALVSDLYARRQRWGISSYVIFEPYVDALAPVVARLAGR